MTYLMGVTMNVDVRRFIGFTITIKRTLMVVVSIGSRDPQYFFGYNQSIPSISDIPNQSPKITRNRIVSKIIVVMPLVIEFVVYKHDYSYYYSYYYYYFFLFE